MENRKELTPEQPTKLGKLSEIGEQILVAAVFFIIIAGISWCFVKLAFGGGPTSGPGENTTPILVQEAQKAYDEAAATKKQTESAVEVKKTELAEAQAKDTEAGEKLVNATTALTGAKKYNNIPLESEKQGFQTAQQ